MTKNKSRPFVLLALGLLWASMTQAQQSSNSTGGAAIGSGGTVEYSVGQVVYTTNTDNGGSLAEGVQQTYLISSVGVKETTLNISVNVFPNPTRDNLTLQISDYQNENFSYQLLNMQGKQLNNGQVTAKQTQINMKSLPPASYFMNVINKEDKKVQSFKIIKN